MNRSGNIVELQGFLATKFKGLKSACTPCQLRSQCLRYLKRTDFRQAAYFHSRSVDGKETFTEKMKRKIDSSAGRTLYRLRVAIAERPFANICHILGLDYFTLRSKKKVKIQWNLFCIVHNLTKVARYGPGFA
ncbi:MAG: transposase [Desulfocapsaceae bacterium]|nr:transposase [Desulfocapsaceae bacterium]